MPASRRPLIAGNWKMNGLKASAGELAAIAGAYDAALRARLDLLVCPPATLLAAFADTVSGTPVMLGGQDCHPLGSGAHTGDISAEMLKDAGASAVIVGHSERRGDHGEGDAVVKAKAKAAWRAGLLAVVCVGESLEEREAGEAAAVVTRQVRQSIPDGASAATLVVAYEPIWAIGTGRTPTTADVAEIHGTIRRVLTERFGAEGEGMRILYGGSVKPDNAAALLATADVDGALVGGASLKAADFLAIARAAL
ncbi:triose-phosphate isomerase [Xanthobacter tagetidis]|uniref:Triosephosphate isomerase n=1 Tax=Xanthobacter tagetidis TaxID=60216 RepID=A0A3L7AF10_9HYPH|nr:triose-phosphate isomerase [Xanthobacter tagetidis]MBB6309679.1 triosephosphate isomerase [Xanthobacter tagetidis]RLP78278.1 triose-phosphate isomerase [Xanthobacter tagetidis]